MVGHPVLGEVVRADLLGAVAGADLLPALLGDGTGLLQVLDLRDFGPQDLQCTVAVRGLASLLARRDHDPGRLVQETDGGLDFVHVLPARPSGAGKSDLQIVRVQLDFLFGRFLEDRDGCRARVHTAGPLGLRHALDTMDAGLMHQCIVRSRPRNLERRVLQAAQRGVGKVDNRERPAFLGGVGLVHLEELHGEQTRLVSARARADLHDGFVAGTGALRGLLGLLGLLGPIFPIVNRVVAHMRTQKAPRRRPAVTAS